MPGRRVVEENLIRTKKEFALLMDDSGCGLSLSVLSKSKPKS